MAADSGADYVKFQMFKTENQVTRNAPKAKYQILNTKNQENQYEMIKKYEFNNAQFKILFKYCKKKKLNF